MRRAARQHGGRDKAAYAIEAEYDWRHEVPLRDQLAHGGAADEHLRRVGRAGGREGGGACSPS